MSESDHHAASFQAPGHTAAGLGPAELGTSADFMQQLNNLSAASSYMGQPEMPHHEGEIATIDYNMISSLMIR